MKLFGRKRPQLDSLDQAAAADEDIEVFFAAQLRDLSVAGNEDDTQRVITAMAARLEKDLGREVHVSRPGGAGDDALPFAINVRLPGQPQFTLAYPDSPVGPYIGIGDQRVTLAEWVTGLRDAFAASREPAIER